MKNVINQKIIIEKRDFEITKIFFSIKKIINIDILNNIKTKDCY